MSTDRPILLNDGLVRRLQNGAEPVDLAGSLYAVPDTHRAAAADLLGRRGIWIHTDVFDDVRTGVSLDLIAELADNGAGLIDVHLLTHRAVSAAFDVVCRPGISRITLPYEGIDDVAALTKRIRAVGARPWLAISPDTRIEQCRDALAHVDGLLVMLIEPGTKQTADTAHLAKVAEAHDRCATGVDGGVHEGIIGEVLAAGTNYVVVGRRLFMCSTMSHT